MVVAEHCTHRPSLPSLDMLAANFALPCPNLYVRCWMVSTSAIFCHFFLPPFKSNRLYLSQLWIRTAPIYEFQHLLFSRTCICVQPKFTPAIIVRHFTSSSPPPRVAFIIVACQPNIIDKEHHSAHVPV